MDPIAAYGPDGAEAVRRINWTRAKARRPSAVSILDLSHLRVHTLPPLENLPAEVKWILCNGTQIRQLPLIPDGCFGLNCSDTPLETLPRLPKTLQILTCSNTPLKELPELPPALYALHCASTGLTALPDLPAGLDIIRVEGSPLRSQRHGGESVQEYASRLRVQARARRLHEELAAAAMYPRRIERLVAAHGLEVLEWGI